LIEGDFWWVYRSSDDALFIYQKITHRLTPKPNSLGTSENVHYMYKRPFTILIKWFPTKSWMIWAMPLLCPDRPGVKKGTAYRFTFKYPQSLSASLYRRVVESLSFESHYRRRSLPTISVMPLLGFLSAWNPLRWNDSKSGKKQALSMWSHIRVRFPRSKSPFPILKDGKSMGWKLNFMKLIEKYQGNISGVKLFHRMSPTSLYSGRRSPKSDE